MSDRTSPERDSPATETARDDSRLERRRRLLKGGLGAAPVLMSLASRPVLGADRLCTPSGMFSGGSLPAEMPSCEGCTPGFWKVEPHIDEWGYAGVDPCDTFESVFGSQHPTGKELTLIETLCEGGGDDIARARHAVAAYLNARHPYVDFGASPEQVIDLYHDGFNFVVLNDADENPLGLDIFCPLPFKEETSTGGGAACDYCDDDA